MHSYQRKFIDKEQHAFSIPLVDISSSPYGIIKKHLYHPDKNESKDSSYFRDIKKQRGQSFAVLISKISLP